MNGKAWIVRSAGSALLLLAASLAGCGYALVGRGSNIPPDVKNVFLQPLENRTQRSQVEQALTRAIADELVTRQRFAVVGNAEQADAVISGAVVGFLATPVTFDATGRATEYEISITAQIAFKRSGEDKPIWSHGVTPFDIPSGEVKKSDKPAPPTYTAVFAETLIKLAEKDPNVLHAAYNDRQGVTARFNKNLLLHVNDAIGADFDPTLFDHYAFYDPREGRVEMHLVSAVAQEVQVAGDTVAFAEGEAVQTENSYKYTVAEFGRTARGSGFVPRRVWMDDAQLFSVHYLEVGG